jgi:hypothetical protein
MLTTTTKSRWLLILLALLASLALVVAACGGDSDDDEDTDEVATETEDTGDDEEEEEEDPTEDAGEGEDGDARSSLEKLAASGELASGVVTYTITSEGTEDSTWTVYSDGENSRVDFGEGESAFISITTPDASYYCTALAGASSCFEGEGSEGVNPFAGLFTQYGTSEAVIDYLDVYGDAEIDQSTEEIAGVDANCYATSGDLTGDAGTVKWCYAESGLLLLSSYDLDSGGFAMEATEFTDDVPSDAFEPPYEITEIPGF